LGKRVGDEVRIQIPGGLRVMEVVELKTIHDLAPRELAKD
jgi:transcription elongation GreA/GreB family factor